MPHRLASSQAPEPLFSDYTSRILLALTAVLATAVVIANVPGSNGMQYTPWGQDDWSLNKGGGTIAAHDVLKLYPNAQVISNEKTAEESAEKDQSTDGAAKASNRVSEVEPQPDRKRRAFRSVATLGPDADKPRVLGGMQQLYLNVRYPQEAKENRIQGRVILNFVVHETGRVSDIQVLRSLHPLCDSAVVRAVRKTTFIPAEENGERVAVRMALPVRFQLLGLPGPEDINAAASNETAAQAMSEGTQTLDTPR